MGSDVLQLNDSLVIFSSTGLHLQNSLLKVREMEKLFELLEKQKKEGREQVNSLIPSETQIIEWLKGFQDVQVGIRPNLINKMVKF